ncbi:hypothetical protein [Seleniivibrio woodruffii]|uniref:Uncharacterized protein n=1 Tax=Seleniivibrio woodruffii TaxID=1078050 RepID=A0A4R1KE19_9BACT|nr:hypothetical protein [Seleniivibrio woodruffii]TCK62357.1 hypothetical protein C8D98_0882 [Seleniivibrio woodruffii]TVZ34526.1 hypothetical protein OF66_0111 [Seleniivibrio woodruffii]
MDKKSILILGSKPDPIIPKKDYDTVVFVNGSIHLKNDKITSRQVVHIMSSSILFGESLLIEKTVDCFRNKSVDEAVVITYFPDKKSIEDISKRLLELNYTYNRITLYSPEEFEQKFLFFSHVQYWKTFLINIFNKNFSCKEKINTARSYLRGRVHLSTGFFSIFYALKEKDIAEVVVSGIGMVTGGYSYLSGYRGHQYKDFIALQLLKNTGYVSRLNFTDSELNKIGLQYND